MRRPILLLLCVLFLNAGEIRDRLKDAGIELKIEERPSSDFSKITSERDFDLLLSGFAASDPFGPAFFGQTYASDSTLNKSGVAERKHGLDAPEPHES